MASIRRTLSPAYHDRSYQNGAIPIAGPSPKYTRKGQHLQPSWKRFVLQFSLFFVIGFVFGMVPFRSSVDDRNHDLISPVNVKFNRRFNLEHREFVLNPRSLGVEKLLNVKEKVMVIRKKQVIVVTPTYSRAFQAYFLSRLAQTLRLVPPPLLWIVVEMNAPSMETAELLRNSGVMYRHLVCTKNLTNIKDRGVHQRNKALEHIEHHRLDGIVYFADDDNVFSLELFESLREISRFGTWPVAMLAQSKNKAILEGPVCNGSQVIGWHTNEKSKRLRRFHVDMSGFAFNSTILWDPRNWRRPTLAQIRQFDTVKEGFQETTFIEQVVEDENQMEAIPPGCLSILNWHLHLEARDLFYPRGWLLQKDLDVVLPFFMMGTHTILHAESHMPDSR